MISTISRSIAGTKSLRSEAAFDAIWSVMNTVPVFESEYSSHLFSSNDQFNMFLKRHLRSAELNFTTAHWDLLVRLASDEICPNRNGHHQISTEKIASSKYGSAVLFISLILMQTYGESHAYRRTAWIDNESQRRDIIQDVVLSIITRPSGSETLQSTIIRKQLQAPQVMVAIKQNIQDVLYKRFNRLQLDIDPYVEVLSSQGESAAGRSFYIPMSAEETEDLMQLEFLKEFMQRAYDDMTPEEQRVMVIWMDPEVQDTLKGCRTFRSQLASIRHLTGLTEYRSNLLADSIVGRFRTLLSIRNFVKVETRQVYKSQATRSKIARGIQSHKSAEMVKRDIKRNCFVSPYIDEADAELMFDNVSRGFNVLIPSVL